jgi:hypothetical protein
MYYYCLYFSGLLQLPPICRVHVCAITVKIISSPVECKQIEIQNNQLQALITALGNIKNQNQVNEFSKTLFGSGILKKGSLQSQ